MSTLLSLSCDQWRNVFVHCFFERLIRHYFKIQKQAIKGGLKIAVSNKYTESSEIPVKENSFSKYASLCLATLLRIISFTQIFQDFSILGDCSHPKVYYW